MNRHPDSHNQSPPPPSPPPQPLQQFNPHYLALPPPPQRTPPTNFGLTQNQRKRRTKLVPVDSPGASSSSGVQKKKYSKPDPKAPNVTDPCTECGREFWSWKALFGHMRCHPERQWRGINPPPNVIRPNVVRPNVVRPNVVRPNVVRQNVVRQRLEAPVAVAAAAGSSSASRVEMTEEDRDVAASLLLLANRSHYESALVIRDAEDNANCRFECSCCKKVFNSHQALGGHRASHKNVKGCFANTQYEEGQTSNREGEYGGGGAGCSGEGSSSMALVVVRHSCSICSKVFPTGQALGGHMRCHWDKTDESPQLPTNALALQPSSSSRALDLNEPAPTDHELSPTDVRLDLRLGL